MDVLDLPASASGRPTPATAASGAPVRRDASGEAGVRQYGGQRWTFRAGFESLLAAMPPERWEAPAEQGWRRVKRNARREVWRASIGGASFYVKYFLANTWLDRLKVAVRGPECEAEWRSGLYALAAGIPAARPMGYTPNVRLNGRPCSLLVTAAVEPAQALSEFWRLLLADENRKRGLADRAALIEKLAQMIARAHQAGFAHLDLHAANILVQTLAPRQYSPVFVDLQSARLDAPLSDNAVVRNLTQLNQWFRRNASIGERMRFLRAYLRWRNEYEHAFAHGRALRLAMPELVRALADAADSHANALWARRDRAAMRQGRYFARLRLPDGWRGMGLVQSKRAPLSGGFGELSREWWSGRLRKPLELFSGADACKDSHSAQVARARLAATDGSGLDVIVKRPRARNGLRKLRGLLGDSRARRGWRMGHALLNRDIATPRPLAFLERRIGPFRLDSLLITERVSEALDLDAFIRERHAQLPSAEWLRLRRELADSLARRLRQLQVAGFAHRDCKAQNILVKDADPRKLLWIDMDGLSRPGRLSASRRLAPLARLHVSLLETPGLNRADRVRFLKVYCAGFGADPNAWRKLWRQLDEPIRKKLATLQTRREWKMRHYGRA